MSSEREARKKDMVAQNAIWTEHVKKEAPVVTRDPFLFATFLIASCLIAVRAGEYTWTPVYTPNLCVNCCHIADFANLRDIPRFDCLFEGGKWAPTYIGLAASVWHHYGIAHTFVVVVSLCYLGSLLEPRFGALKFFLLNGFLVLANGVMFHLTAFAMGLVHYPFWFDSMRGYSGILFSLVTMEISIREAEKLHSIRALQAIPAWILPWALLIPTQILSLSLKLRIPIVAHIAGILTGLIFAHFYHRRQDSLRRRLVQQPAGGASAVVQRDSASSRIWKSVTSSWPFRNRPEYAAVPTTEPVENDHVVHGQTTPRHSRTRDSSRAVS